MTAAASARLCVETLKHNRPGCRIVAAASARLCVETIMESKQINIENGSRLRAAVC